MENETFCNLEEYLFGEDPDRDGINEWSPHPNVWDSDDDQIPDGWEALLLDRDGDGMSNWFELTFGLNPFEAEGEDGADGDPDEDGYSNLQEFLANSNPTDPGSHPGNPPGHPGDGPGLFWDVVHGTGTTSTRGG